MRKELSKHPLLSSFLFFWPEERELKAWGWGMELQTKVGSGDGQDQTGTAHLWLPPVPGAQGLLPARKKGTEIPLFQPWSCWECSSVENTTSQVWMSPVPQGCPGHGHLSVPRQPAERLQIKLKWLNLIEFCVGTAHSGQDECELGELLRCIKRSRHCIVFKGRFMNHPSAQHAQFTLRGLLFLVKLSKPMLLGFSLHFNRAQNEATFWWQQSSQDSGNVCCHAKLYKNALFFPLLYKETVNPWFGPEYHL